MLESFRQKTEEERLKLEEEVLKRIQLETVTMLDERKLVMEAR